MSVCLSREVPLESLLSKAHFQISPSASCFILDPVLCSLLKLSALLDMPRVWKERKTVPNLCGSFVVDCSGCVMIPGCALCDIRKGHLEPPKTFKMELVQNGSIAKQRTPQLSVCRLKNLRANRTSQPPFIKIQSLSPVQNDKTWA